ncbi:DUF6282 family protein [Pelagibacterium limicola]|uniref:DUF6282 family protein n=1 Tax=Pelagibacterium limicola TaxID=2791022 RepID=UPI0018AF77E6|nr:DUF6282 family protein [Pelagibacterium limicola]
MASEKSPEITDALIDSLMEGAIDLHCHSGPSIMERKLDHIEAAREAEAAGMRALMFKDHYYSSTPVVQLLKRQEFASSSLSLLSGVVLNNATGGLNPYAVEHDLMLGGQLIWMPTISAANHIRHVHRSGALKPPRPMKRHKGLEVTDALGNLFDEVKEILDIIAEYDGVLSAGHLHISEIWVLFAEAQKRGVGRLLVNHPGLFIDASLADMRELAGMGVFMEQCACMVIDCPSRHFDPDELKSFIDAATVGQTILGSDLGQMKNPRPVEGYRAVIRLCLELGYNEQDVRAMVSGNATRLLGLDTNGSATS